MALPRLTVPLVGLLLVLGACRGVQQAGGGRATVDAPPRAVSNEPISATNLEALLAALPPDRAPGSAGHAAARRWLEGEVRALGLQPDWQTFTWDGLPELELANLEVRLGPSSTGPLLIAGAHYDGVPGSAAADDNGSGVVALLEIARRMVGRTLPAEVRLVWFDAEEVGLLGSRAYAARLSPEERARCLGLVDLEAIGYTDRRPGSQHLPPGARLLHDPGDVGDFVLVLGNVASAELARLVGLALQAEAGPDMRAEVFSALPGAGWILPDSRRSDHASFWDAGLPAVMVTDTAPFRNPHYHKASDRWETLDLRFLAAVARGVERALLVGAGEAAAAPAP